MLVLSHRKEEAKNFRYYARLQRMEYYQKGGAGIATGNMKMALPKENIWVAEKMLITYTFALSASRATASEEKIANLLRRRLGGRQCRLLFFSQRVTRCTAIYEECKSDIFDTPVWSVIAIDQTGAITGGDFVTLSDWQQLHSRLRDRRHFKSVQQQKDVMSSAFVRFGLLTAPVLGQDALHVYVAQGLTASYVLLLPSIHYDNTDLQPVDDVQFLSDRTRTRINTKAARARVLAARRSSGIALAKVVRAR